MKILHITPSTDGYEEVELLANNVSRKNHFAAIQKNGEIFYTGGFLINDNPLNRKILDSIPREEQLEFVKGFIMTPWKKSYFEEN